MSEPERFLERHRFFQGMSAEHLALMGSCCRATMLTFDPGYPIFLEGQPADSCYLLDEGDVALQVHAPGTGLRTLETLHGGDVLGWSWLFPPYEWTFDARAVSEVRALGLDAVRLRNAKEIDHEFGYELLWRFASVVVDRLQATRLQLLDMYAGPD